MARRVDRAPGRMGFPGARGLRSSAERRLRWSREASSSARWAFLLWCARCGKTATGSSHFPRFWFCPGSLSAASEDAWVAVCLLLPAVALFPFARYRQSRIRVRRSSGGSSPGHPECWCRRRVPEKDPLIAVSSLAEQRPGSFILRASKVLAESGWNGEGYRLLTPTQDAVSRRLDELAVDIVILRHGCQSKAMAPSRFTPGHY